MGFGRERGIWGVWLIFSRYKLYHKGTVGKFPVRQP